MPKKKEIQIIAYKGFNQSMQCTGGNAPYQYEEGKTYTHDGEVQACSSGFHSCEYPLDCFSYYAPGESRYHEVLVSGDISRHDDDTKIASASITIKAQLHVPEIVSRAISWITERCDPVKAVHTKKDRSASSATGDQSASSATGTQSASSATGTQSASSATGTQSASSATGDQSASSATGYRSASSATGKSAVAINIGYFGKAMADENGAIVLVNHDNDRFIRHIRASKVGENGIEKNVWYILNDDGEFEKA
jgi:hypothetical protein